MAGELAVHRLVTVGEVAVRLLDSVASLTEDDRDAVVVSASHGGRSAAEHALHFRPRVIAFNDAGGGKDDAGFVALALLEPYGIAALTVAHTSARIGEAEDAWRHGVVSRVNGVAAAHGATAGMLLRAAIITLAAG